MCHKQGSHIETSEPICWFVSQANVGNNQLNNREIAAGCPNPAALAINNQLVLLLNFGSS